MYAWTTSSPKCSIMRASFVDALRVGGDLGAQVGEVGRRVAGGVGAVGEQAQGLRLAEAAALHQQPVVEEDALLLDGAAVGRHGAGGDAADLRVVSARGHVGRGPAVPPPGVSKTGVTTVTSGRWVPPWYGSLTA